MGSKQTPWCRGFVRFPSRRGRCADVPTLQPRQTQSGSAGAAVVAIVDLRERLEHFLQFFAFDTGTVVLDGEDETAGIAAPAMNFDPTALWRVLQRVGHEIECDLLERSLVGDGRGRSILDDKVQLLFLLPRPMRHHSLEAVPTEELISRREIKE